MRQRKAISKHTRTRHIGQFDISGYKIRINALLAKSERRCVRHCKKDFGNKALSRYPHYLLEIVDDARHASASYLTSPTSIDFCSKIPRATLHSIKPNLQIEELGLRYGLRIYPADHRILGYAFLSSANLSKALKIFSTYQRILGLNVDVFIHVEVDQACYTAVRAGTIEQTSTISAWKPGLRRLPMFFRFTGMANSLIPQLDQSFGGNRAELRFTLDIAVLALRTDTMGSEVPRGSKALAQHHRNSSARSIGVCNESRDADSLDCA